MGLTSSQDSAPTPVASVRPAPLAEVAPTTTPLASSAAVTALVAEASNPLYSSMVYVPFHGRLNPDASGTDLTSKRSGSEEEVSLEKH